MATLRKRINTRLILIIASLLTFSSCGRIKEKGQELVDTAVQSGKEQAKNIADEVIPHFDAYTPDTKYNKERYTEFILPELTADVKNIYCFGDAMGIDANYQFAFTCDTATARRIIEHHQLKADSTKSYGIYNEFAWWDMKKIETLDGFVFEGEHQIFTRFWYDEGEQNAYFSTYDL